MYLVFFFFVLLMYSGSLPTCSLGSFMREAACLAVDAPVLRDDFVVTLRPEFDPSSEGFCGFDIIETDDVHRKSGRDTEGNQRLESTKVLRLDNANHREGATCSRLIPPEIRACAAPAFGIEDSGDLFSTLRGFDHLRSYT
jgi:hypothetical protein